MIQIRVLIALCYIQTFTLAADLIHRSQPVSGQFLGWQEPGLWRPKWIMDREIYSDDGKSNYRDRMYFKLKSNRTVQIYKSNSILDWLKALLSGEKVGIFSKIEEKSQAKEDNNSESKWVELYSSDGSWTYNPGPGPPAPPTDQVVIESREGPDRIRIKYESRLKWGKSDPYSAFFRKGRIYNYKGCKKGSDIPIGQYEVGRCMIRPTIHRPLLSKEFTAIQ